MKLGATELIVIFVVALIVIGPDKLPEYAQKLGKALRSFKKMSSEVTEDIRKEVVEPLNEAQKPLREAMEPINEAMEPINDLKKSVEGNVKDLQKSVNSIGKPVSTKVQNTEAKTQETTVSSDDAASAQQAEADTTPITENNSAQQVETEAVPVVENEAAQQTGSADPSDKTSPDTFASDDAQTVQPAETAEKVTVNEQPMSVVEG